MLKRSSQFIATFLLSISSTILYADELPSAINQLPSYDNPKAINQLLNRNQATQVKEGGIPPDLLQQMQKLEQNQQNLMQQMQTQDTSGASSSGIFFAGGAPAASSESTLGNKSSPNMMGGLGSSLNPVTQQLNFLKTGDDDNTADSQINPNQLQKPSSPYIVQAGAFIPAVLQTGINSDVPGQVTAIITQNIFDSPTGKFLLIPKGSKVIGLYNSDIPYGGSRLQVKFTRLIRPDGSSIVLTNPLGTNAIGESGLNGDVNNHWARIVGSGILSAAFTMPAVVATQNQNTQSCTSTNGITTCMPIGPSMASSALLAGSSAASQFGSTIANKSLNIKPTITLPPGTIFNVLVNKDMVLDPVKS